MSWNVYRVYQILQLGSNIQQPQGWETQVKSSVPLGCTEQCDCATGMQYDDARMMFIWCLYDVQETRKIPPQRRHWPRDLWWKLVKSIVVTLIMTVCRKASQGKWSGSIPDVYWIVVTVTQGILQVRCWTRRLPSMGHFRGIFHNTSP